MESIFLNESALNDPTFQYVLCFTLIGISLLGFIFSLAFWIISTSAYEKKYASSMEILLDVIKIHFLYNNLQRFLFHRGLEILESKNLKVLYLSYFATAVSISYFLSNWIFYPLIIFLVINIFVFWGIKYDMKYLYGWGRPQQFEDEYGPPVSEEFLKKFGNGMKRPYPEEK